MWADGQANCHRCGRKARVLSLVEGGAGCHFGYFALGLDLLHEFLGTMKYSTIKTPQKAGQHAVLVAWCHCFRYCIFTEIDANAPFRLKVFGSYAEKKHDYRKRAVDCLKSVETSFRCARDGNKILVEVLIMRIKEHASFDCCKRCRDN